MNENRRQILEMLSAGKITADEADRLLAALEPDMASSARVHPASAGAADSSTAAAVKTRAKYLRVQVEADPAMTGMKGPTMVNVRVPMQLLRAGVRLAGLIPKQAHDQLDEAFTKHGVPITLSQIKPENLEELIDHLEDLTVDVDGKDGNSTRVKVFCE
jgi:hypothetical protein